MASNPPSPISATKIGSAGLLMVWTARREKALAGGLWLVAGFLLTLFIRELDGWMDAISLNFWVYVAIIWLCVVAWLVKDAGVWTVILLVYSRLYGKKTLWLAYAGDACQGFYAVKTLSEESTELLAYMMIFTSVVFYAGNCLRMRRRRDRALRRRTLEMQG